VVVVWCVLWLCHFDCGFAGVIEVVVVVLASVVFVLVVTQLATVGVAMVAVFVVVVVFAEVDFLVRLLCDCVSEGDSCGCGGQDVSGGCCVCQVVT